jgi:hypothetical protein
METKPSGGEGMGSQINPAESELKESNVVSAELARFVRREGLPIGSASKDFGMTIDPTIRDGMKIAEANPNSAFAYMAIDYNEHPVWIWGINQEYIDKAPEEIKNELASVRKEPRFC